MQSFLKESAAQDCEGFGTLFRYKGTDNACKALSR